jgi:hypothetical protein
VFHSVRFLCEAPEIGVYITPKRVGPDINFLIEFLTLLCVSKLVVNKYFSEQ